MVRARTKFIIGGILVLGTAGYLMASSIGDTGMYYLTPVELTAKVKGDPTFYETGVKMGARVVPGTIQREAGGRAVSFAVTDGSQTIPVTYRGVIPDTFTDSVDMLFASIGRNTNVDTGAGSDFVSINEVGFNGAAITIVRPLYFRQSFRA